MGALSHYLERAGIATTQVSLVREHSEKIRPPRALWCGFELGRPFGVPNEPDFQRRVLVRVLNLLDRTDGPILDTFPDPAPGGGVDDLEDIEGWSCPVNFGGPEPLSFDEDPRGALGQEIDLMATWHELFLEKNKKSMLGVSEVDLDACLDYVVQFAEDEFTKPPRDDVPRHQVLKLALDDIKTYYFEAGLARPGIATDKALADWYYGETTISKVLRRVNKVCEESDDEVLVTMSDRRVFPIHQQHRKDPNQ